MSPPSVRPSVRLSLWPSVYVFHTGWNRPTSKVISRLISLRFLSVLTPTWVIWSNGNTPKIGRNRRGVMSTQLAISLKWCKMRPRLQWRTNRKSHTHCRLVLKSDDLKRTTRTLAEKTFYGAHEKNVNEDRPTLSAAKCRPMTLWKRGFFSCFCSFPLRLFSPKWHEHTNANHYRSWIFTKKFRYGVVLPPPQKITSVDTKCLISPRTDTKIQGIRF